MDPVKHAFENDLKKKMKSGTSQVFDPQNPYLIQVSWQSKEKKMICDRLNHCGIPAEIFVGH
jgi:hypothetical protein